jgi:hypothetical protein
VRAPWDRRGYVNVAGAATRAKEALVGGETSASRIAHYLGEALKGDHEGARVVPGYGAGNLEIPDGMARHEILERPWGP